MAKAGRIALAAIVAAFFLGGCVTVSDDSQRAKANEFNAKGFDDAMEKAGKGDELAEARKREQEYLSAGGGGAANQDGPTNAPGAPGK